MINLVFGCQMLFSLSWPLGAIAFKLTVRIFSTKSTTPSLMLFTLPLCPLNFTSNPLSDQINHFAKPYSQQILRITTK